jgi:5'-methylthioadenosine phosphorylase
MRAERIGGYDALKRIGIIGGSGTSDFWGGAPKDRFAVKTPFGEPSETFELYDIGGREIVFLSRHGAGHRLLPGEINYRANVWAFKKLGVEWILSISAVGSFKKEIKPGDFVLVDQYFDRTIRDRLNTFFGEGLVAHIAFKHPVCGELRRVLFEAGHEEGFGSRMHLGGTYLNIEGPAFSTRAESLLYKSWGFDVVGMTSLVEAKLCREAEICYAPLAMVTDYDCWVEDQDRNIVSSDLVLAAMHKNVEAVRRIVFRAVSHITDERSCSCANALRGALVTRPESIPRETREKLDLIVGRYLK